MLLTFSGQGLHMDRFPPCGAKDQRPESVGGGGRFGDHSIQRAQSFRASGRVVLPAVMRSLEAEGSSLDEHSAHGSCICLEGVGAIGPHF